jgi:hypothetical protein
MSTPFFGTGRFSRRQFCRSSAVAAGALMMSGLPLPVQARAAEGRENIQVSHDAFTLHAETYLTANPRQPRNLLGISIVVGATSNYSLATYVSFDGAASWRSNGALPMPAGALSAVDPTVAFDGAGRGFACGTVAYGTQPTDREVCVWRSVDGGRSFAAPVLAMQGQTVDHPWLAADRSIGPSSSNLYVVWAAESLTQLGFARSTDGGGSFEPPRTITDVEKIAVAGAMVAPGTHGLVAAIYGAESLLPGGGDDGSDGDAGSSGSGGQRRPEVTGTIRVVCSTDYGQTFSEPIELGTASLELLFPDGQAGSASLPTIAVEQRRNILYAAFVTHQSQAGYSDILLSASYDYGHTWSPAQSITPGNTSLIYFQPQLAVDEMGRVAVSAYAFDSTQNLANVVLFVSDPHTLRFGPPLTITSQPFDPAQGGASGGSKHGTWWIGDFQGLTSTPGAFHPFWDDTRTGELEVFTAIVPTSQW